jgi:hypothetical protein
MNRFTTADVFLRVSRSSRMSSMAKKPPHTEADDTNTASANREARSSGARTEGRQSAAGERNRTTRGTQGTATEELTPQTDDTFAALAHDSSEYAPTEEEIRYRAYLLYIERGGGHGLDFEDWLQAERELKNRSR